MARTLAGHRLRTASDEGRRPRALYRVEDILEHESRHLADSTKSRVHHKEPEKPIAKPASVPRANRGPGLPESEWSSITAEVQDGLLIGGDLEYCLARGELRLRPVRMFLGRAPRVVSGN